LVIATRSTLEEVSPAAAAAELAALGFVVHSDLPDRPGPARLLVAIRERPTLRHYDPELVEYWVSDSGRGRPRTLTYDTRLPVATEFSWGLIRIVDRLAVTNEYLTFGGHLTAESINGDVVCAFASPAPLLRRGGHSQGWDHGAECVGAFFGRLLLAVDVVPGFEAEVSAATPAARYAAFIADIVARYRASPILRDCHTELWALLQAEAEALIADDATWSAGHALLESMSGCHRSPTSPEGSAP
jgi:hypothetical protein